jgi:NADH-quinone oxidoreductase subunit A
MDPRLTVVQQGARGEGRGASDVELTPAASGLYRELGVARPTVPQSSGTVAATGNKTGAATPLEQADQTIRSDAAQLARLSMIDIGAFFAVLLVGFAYVWRRGDLDWVRAMSRERSTGVEPPEPPAVLERQPVISA